MASSVDSELTGSRICSEISKFWKREFGKGPFSVKPIFFEKGILLMIDGQMLPPEKRLAHSDQGFYDVKFNRMKWFTANKELIQQKLNNILERRVELMFYDVDPRADKGVLVILFE